MSICAVFGNIFVDNVCYGILVEVSPARSLLAEEEKSSYPSPPEITFKVQVVHLYKTLSLSTLYRQLLLLTKKYKPSMMFTLFSKFFLLKSLIFTKIRPCPPGLMRGTGRRARPPSPPACWTKGWPRAPRSVDEVVPDTDEQRLDVTDELDTKLGEELARMLFDDVGGLVISTAVKNRTWPV